MIRRFQAGRALVAATGTLLLVSGCVHPGPPPPSLNLAEREQVGLASWYGSELKGHQTANGEAFDPGALTAAHRTLPFGACVRVGLVASSRFVEVRINDRGPFVSQRIIDLSEAAARALGIWSLPPAQVRLGPCGGPEQHH
jgi:rare lipoprotein A (peptidoglycan hydrolase)